MHGQEDLATVLKDQRSSSIIISQAVDIAIARNPGPVEHVEEVDLS